jgi:beta-N-acetylhexosaminidase
MEEERQPEEKPREAPPQALIRRLRTLVPVSPLPWHWHRRINRGALIAIAAIVVGGAVASILIQRISDSGSEPAPEVDAPKEVKGLLGELSLEQKADGVVIAGFDDPDSIEAALEKSSIGGVLVGPDDWQRGGAGLVKRLRGATSAQRVPALIVAQQEGGIYRAYPGLPPAEREVEIGDLGDPALAQASAQETGAALKAAGFDLNLAPVADVATLDSPVADRAYSDDPNVVTAMASAAAAGCAASGTACAFSHFPGLGAASEDPARGPATVSLDPATLEARDLPPFSAAFEAGAPATVLSLAFYAAYDPATPAALSHAVATDLLRDELGFEGVAISDDLTLGAITAGLGAPEAAVQALAAGTDMVLVDDPVATEEARAAILEAARSGAISPSRLDQAIARVLDLKRQLGLVAAPAPAKGSAKKG